jgi:hypothetical protein
MRIPTTSRWTLGIGFLLVAAAGAALAAPNNAGDVKVKNPDNTGSPENHPHVGCTFFVEGFNMEASSGTITFKAWPPTGDMTVVHATGANESWTSDGANDQGNHHFVSGPYSLPDTHTHVQGTHYKVFVTDEKHDKMKVFWVKCDTESGGCVEDCQPPCRENCDETPPPCEEDCVEIPYFPSVASLALGAVGAAGSVLLALRRRS